MSNRVKWETYALGFVAILVARAVNIIIGCLVMNLSRKKHKITFGHAFLMWFSGFRGALAFSMGIICFNMFPDFGSYFLDLTVVFTCITVSSPRSSLILSVLNMNSTKAFHLTHAWTDSASVFVLFLLFFSFKAISF